MAEEHRGLVVQELEAWTAMAVKMPALSPKWWAGAAWETPARLAISRMDMRPVPTAAISSSAASSTTSRSRPWWYGRFSASPVRAGDGGAIGARLPA